MTYRKQALLLMLVSAVVIIWGVQFAVSCPSNDSVCIVGHGAIAQPSVLFSVSLLITCLALFFVREDVFKSWRKFAYFAIPISIILLWLAPPTTHLGVQLLGRLLVGYANSRNYNRWAECKKTFLDSHKFMSSWASFLLSYLQ